MLKNNPLDNFSRSSDLYAFVLENYKFLDSVSIGDLHKAYNRFQNEKEVEEDGKYVEAMKKLDDLVDYLVFAHTIGFIAWKQNWLDMAGTTAVPLPVFCLCTLLRIDAIIKIIAFDKDRPLIFEGPMSTDNTYFLYLRKPRSSFFSAVLNSEKIYPGRTTIQFFNDSVNKYFKNFVVIKESFLCDMRPVVYRYSGKKTFTESIKIAVVPFYQSPWFRTHFNDGARTFSISYSDYKMKISNQAYKNSIIQADNNLADIIIFPELAMNATTEDFVKDVLLSTPKSFEHLKFCFLGSAWIDKNNISSLMSSSGTVLARQKKKEPYYHFHHDDIYYREDIKHDKNVTLIDIESFGRIAYCICADINAKEIQNLLELMEVDFVFVSSYTKNTETMFTAAESKACLSAMSTVLCNARSAKDPQKPDKHSNGFCIVPKAKNKKLFAKSVSYIVDDDDNHNQEIFYFDLHFDSCK